MKRLVICAALLLASSAFAASSGSPVGYAARIRSGAALPATCVSSVIVRDVFYKTGASAGLYVCTAANTWTAQSGASAITGGTCTNQLVSAITAGTGAPTCVSVADAMLSLTAPVLGAPTATTVQTSGNIGAGGAPSATSGQVVLGTAPTNTAGQIKMSSSDASGTSASASLVASADTALANIQANGTGRTLSRWGAAVGGWVEFIVQGGNGMRVGTTIAAPTTVGANAIVGVSFDGTTALPTFPLGLTSTGVITPSQTNGIVGTTTNNNANAGSFGQFITALCPGPATTATITVTIATPAVVTWSGHPFSGTAPRFDACPVVFTTGGALPTGITASTNYWVIPTTISGNNFSIATSVANAIAATAISTSGTQSGTHTGTAGTVLSTTATKDVTGIALTAGDWDCSGATDFQFGATTSYTNLTGSVSTTAATLGGQDTGFDYETPAAVPTAGADMTWSVPTVRQLLSATTNVFLVAQGTFTLSTLKAYGSIRCRRVR